MEVVSKPCQDRWFIIENKKNTGSQMGRGTPKKRYGTAQFFRKMCRNADLT